MPFRPASVVIHPSVQERFDNIAQLAAEGHQPARAIWKGLSTAVTRIKNDGQWGEVIPRSSIPRQFVRMLGVTNLSCVDLPSFHRLLYTIYGRNVVILDLVDHEEHDRLMDR